MRKLQLLWPKLKSNLPTVLISVFLFAVGCMLYSNLGRDYLFDWDEGIYGELGRQIVSGGHWWTNYWNGSPWFEKPPGISWLAGIGIGLFGPTAYGARIFQPLVAIYVLYVVYLIGTRLRSWQTGALAAGILAGFNLFLGRTRAVNVDMPLLASLTTTILLLLAKSSPISLALSIFVGVWFKGLAGLLPVAIAFPLLISQSKTYLLQTALFTLLLIIPWHLSQYLRYGADFTTPYLYEQVLRRATTQIEFHFETRWYYFNYLYENLGLGVLLVAGLGAILSSISAKTRFLVWWVLLPLGLFTLAKTRLFWYILPVYPAVALLSALALTYWSKSKASQAVVTILAVGVLLQGVLAAARSVELDKKIVSPPDRLMVAQSLSSSDTLLVLVPESERLAEALLPAVARLSSSFRYGGMPSLVFYYRGPVEFFYNVDLFNEAFARASSPGLISQADLPKLTSPYRVTVTSPTYVGISQEAYALR